MTLSPDDQLPQRSTTDQSHVSELHMKYFEKVKIQAKATLISRGQML